MKASMIRVGILFIAFIGIALIGGAKMASSQKISYPNFSPDNKNLIFTYCEADDLPCTIGKYSFASQNFTVFPVTVGGSWIHPQYDYDGSRIVFIVRDPDRYISQIAVMNADGSGLRVITDDESYKAGPSFSPDGRRIIFLRASVTPDTRSPDAPSTRTRITAFDVVEIDFGSSKARQLTDFMFYQA